MSVSFSGLQSGLNTDKIIKQLLQIERQPQVRYNSEKKQASKAQDAFRDLNNRMETLGSKINTLNDSNTFDQKAISNTKPDVLSASIVDNQEVQSGQFDVFVEELATNATRTSGKMIHDQRMVDSSKNNATLVSDYEQVEGSGTLDLTGTTSTSEMLSQLSKEVETSGAGNTDFRLDLDDDGDFSEAGENIDLDQYDNFQQLMDDINGSTANQTGDATGKDIDADGNNERFELSYDATTDKFTMEPLVSDGAGGDSLRADDVQGNITDGSKGFLQQIGFNDDATIHHYAQTESDLSESLLSVDPGKNLEDNLFTSDLAAGTNTIRVNSTELSFDPTSESLNDVVSKINDQVEGVNASYNSATDKVTLRTEDTGAGSIDVEDVSGNLADVLNLRDSGSETGGQAGASIDDGTDAKVTIDGNTVTAEGNTVTFDGIQLDLKELHQESNNTGDPVELEVSKDRDAIASEVQGFVDQFNSIMEFINKRNNANPSNSPEERRGESGPFHSDSTVRSIKNKLTQIVTDRFKDATGSDVIQDAGSVGLEQVDPLTAADQNQNKLEFNQSEFKSALDTAPTEVKDLFTADTADGDAADGIATELNDYVDNAVTDNIDGILPSRIDGFDRKIENLNDRIQRNQRRVQQKRQRLEDKFIQMEKLMGSLNEQKKFVNARL